MDEYRKLRNIVTDKKMGKGSILLMSVIHHVRILVHFGQNLVAL